MNLVRLVVLSLCLIPFTLHGQVITGTVTDDKAQPLPSTRITLSDGTSSEITLTTSSGAFQFKNLHPGAFSLSADATGYTHAQAALTLPR